MPLVRLRRSTVLVALAALIFLTIHRFESPQSPLPINRALPPNFRWETRPQLYPVSSMIPLPTGKKATIPKIQIDSPTESAEAREQREARLKAVKETFVHTWKGYKEHAWLADELAPVSGGNKSTFGGWAATLVDSLDTLWLMDLREEFEAAVEAVKAIDFTRTDAESINVFETTIRHLGGFLAAYDISEEKYPVLLEKAREVGEMLYAAFDTPNRMPVARWDWKGAALGNDQAAQEFTLLAEIGSLSLEFTRLSQLTGDPKFFDAIQRITDQLASQQLHTKLPGMWPILVNARAGNFTAKSFFTIGSMADSAYEYLPKEYLLLSGRSSQYRDLYERFLPIAAENLFFRPLNPSNLPILFSGSLMVESPTDRALIPHCQHLACFTGGMVALASKVFDRPDDMKLARELTEGCVWGYDTMASGIMPESFEAVPCQSKEGGCKWDEGQWLTVVGKKLMESEEKEKEKEKDRKAKEDGTQPSEEKIRGWIKDHGLVPGMSDIDDRRYILRPEAIESVFILYRTTGDASLQSTAWRMFQSITKHTRTAFGHAALRDVTLPSPPPQYDKMESFWTAETLKYFWLMFSSHDVLSLDEWVLSTEAHPFRREK
ncbi:hypothetical protein GP486_008040 [Trichoglossum hirsutum]|uniref:alpha-1,2-Mannosidase n=1 Tax=Trichoglossum hirsutum TaxID=265104 RepID=A0A9P8IAQ8_9PEZI|nr:hypothetical protein GP486_008040 [Trichoglossum hirsutum]